MTIDYAILGLLSWKPMTGYDMKKIMQESSVMYWSGNNNQIYKVLIQLLEQGYVTNTIQYQDTAPNKKVYTITPAGITELNRQLTETVPEIPEFKKNFLIQLSWAGSLSNDELDRLAAQYEEVVKECYARETEVQKRQTNFPARSSRETYIWDMISRNLQSAYQAELRWITEFRAGLQTLD